jgi:hypothetical protein
VGVEVLEVVVLDGQAPPETGIHFVFG